MIIITVSMLSIHARSASYGLDQMTTRRSINRFFNSSLWKAPHHCMSLYTPSARTCFLGCGVRAKWIKYDMIARDWAIHTYTYAWANRGELYELIIRQGHLHNIQACLRGVSYIRLQVYFFYTLGVSDGLQICQLVIGLGCAKVWHRQRSKGCTALDLTLILLMCSASNPTIDRLPDRAVRLFSDNSMSLARFLVWTISHVFMQLGNYSPCIGTL